MGDLEALVIRRSLRTRLTLTGAVLAGAGLGTALALGASGDPETPTIAVDSGVPLFTLPAMKPGEPSVERCIAVRASGGAALRLMVSSIRGFVASRRRVW